MPLGQATTKTIPVSFFSFVEPSDFIECLVDLLAIDYTGTITVSKDIQGNQQWTFAVQSTVNPTSKSSTSLKTTLGQVLVWDGSMLKALPQADFDNLYNITP